MGRVRLGEAAGLPAGGAAGLAGGKGAERQREAHRQQDGKDSCCVFHVLYRSFPDGMDYNILFIIIYPGLFVNSFSLFDSCVIILIQ